MTESVTSSVPLSQEAEKRSGVFARKYRPENFDDVIGQDAVVRMLRHALQQNRVAQALVFSGVRGTGKTTLARIVAKGLNCLASPIPTDKPCGECQNCQEIAQGISLDVQEIDAASHTGVDHIRDLISSVSYRASGRFKVYILDEVHMLSTSAFNALLKTLEEPPAHVRFIFATTEIRKIPATVLSRTQRFSLSRVGNNILADFFAKVAEQEGATAEHGATEVIARAADGSVRDGLSLLDQFLSGSGKILTEDFVRTQLGLVGAQTALDCFEALLQGDGRTMLRILDTEHASGAEPLQFIRDLLVLCHQLSRHKVLNNAEDSQFSRDEQETHQRFANQVSMAHLARLWQVLLKGAEEIRLAPDQHMALEMVMMRAHFLADAPTPQQILQHQPAKTQPVKSVGSGHVQPESDPSHTPAQEMHADTGDDLTSHRAGEGLITNFSDLLDVLTTQRETHLVEVLRQDARLQSFSDTKIVLYVPDSERHRVRMLPDLLQSITGKAWDVQLLDSEDGTSPSLLEQQDAEKKKLLEQVQNDPTIQELNHLFPQSNVTHVAR